MSDLTTRNLAATAEDVRSKLHNLAANTSTDLADDNTYLQHLAISLDGLRAAVEQRIQELGSHNPQDFG